MKNNDLTLCENLVDLNATWGSLDVNSYLSSLSSSKKAKTLNFTRTSGYNTVDFNLISNTKIDTIVFDRCYDLKTITLNKDYNLFTALTLIGCTGFEGDLSFMNYLPNITTLLIYNTQNIQSLVGLENKLKLNTINAHDCSINSLVPLLNDTSLATCDFANNKISSLNGIQNLTSLQTLTLDNNSISDLYYLGLLADKGTKLSGVKY